MMKYLLINVIFLSCLLQTLYAQNTLSQTIKGVVQDADSKMPIAGASIQVLNTAQGAVSDSIGQFDISHVNVGRQSIMVTALGFESKVVPEIMVSSGKEIFITVQLTENIQQLREVTISGRRNRVKPINEFATVSARSFSVEETKRFAASAFDPARMAQNFAGVANNGDFSNEIVVRGNSPKGVLWRLEGIEIPNPNHFTALGASGGTISMLSSSTLGSSDFYTGAFPSEFGNATSGVFDLSFRTGNKDKREYSLMVGGMGIEAATEGYFKKGGGSSYLVNYRYSTLSLMKDFLPSLDGIAPDYQDLSFKLNFPTSRLGTFSLFGLGGANRAFRNPEKDSTKWEGDNPNFVYDERSRTGILGISNQVFLNDHAYIKTVLSVSGNYTNGRVDSLNANDHYSVHLVTSNKNTDLAYRATVLYNNKINTRHTLRTGVIASKLAFDYNSLLYDDVDKLWRNILGSKGDAGYYQAYAQWKYRINNRFIVNTGLHSSYFAFNETYSVEPRVNITYQAGQNQSFTLAAGLHAKPEHLSTYMLDNNDRSDDAHYPNKELDLTKAAHMVLAYDKAFGKGLHLKAEVYYQHLYDVPVEKEHGSHFSILNTGNIYDLLDIDTLVSKGTGKNYGIDLTIEKPFSRNYYFLATASLFQSKYNNYDGSEYNTRYNRNYQLNIVGGKEWKNKKNKIWGLNGKVLTTGGLKYSPIDIEASRLREKEVYVNDKYYTKSQPAYFRFDIGLSYKINRASSTHTIMLDIQNLTNYQNLYVSYYNHKQEKVKNIYQMGFFPLINYRVEF